MKFRTTIILLVILVALGGYVFWSERQQPDTSTATGTTTIPIFQLDPGVIQAVEVRGLGKQVRVEHDANGWQVHAPKPGPADAFRVTQVISDLAKLNATQTITPAGQDLAPYGLNKPAYEVLVEGGAPETLRVGSKNPDGSATYVQRASAPTVYLVKDPLIETIERWVDDPPVQPTPVPTAPPLTVLPTAPVTPTSAITPTSAVTPTPAVTPTSAVMPTPAVTPTATFLPAGPPLKSSLPTLVPTSTEQK